MDIVRSPNQCWSGKKVRKKGFDWSEVHLYQSNFLWNPYFSHWNFLYSAQILHCHSPVLVLSIQRKTWSSFLSALLNWRKNSNFFKLAVLRSNSMNGARRALSLTFSRNFQSISKQITGKELFGSTLFLSGSNQFLVFKNLQHILLLKIQGKTNWA